MDNLHHLQKKQWLRWFWQSKRLAELRTTRLVCIVTGVVCHCHHEVKIYTGSLAGQARCAGYVGTSIFSAPQSNRGVWEGNRSGNMPTQHPPVRIWSFYHSYITEIRVAATKEGSSWPSLYSEELWVNFKYINFYCYLRIMYCQLLIYIHIIYFI